MRAFSGNGVGLVTIVVAILLIKWVPSAAASDIAQVVTVNGSPTVMRAEKREPLKRGDGLNAGDAVETDEHAKVKLLLSDDSVLAIGPKSRVVIERMRIEPAARTARLRVLAGRFQIAIAKFFRGPTDYEIQTPTAVAGVRGTVLWGDTDLDAICDLEGAVTVRSTQGTSAATPLNSGQCVHNMAGGTTEPLVPSAAELAAYLREVTLD
ncbi:MAG: FecR domain-containing protein [Deltaproteobacteria bacterium]|nr:FecR domain-containing protein [Deltaproteobacteria bacterium]MBI3389917.1 FecR domain-containing protein [Deltaproteobacteria bacterium]